MTAKAAKSVRNVIGDGRKTKIGVPPIHCPMKRMRKRFWPKRGLVPVLTI
jgi:hypothetical protein